METKDQIHRLVDHLYRHEAGKIVSVLTHVFGPENIELAEDVMHDSLIEAMKDWSYKGVPKDPSAWLYTVARNKALNVLNREKYRKESASSLAHHFQSARDSDTTLDEIFSPHSIQDDQLRMIFTSCHPALTKDSQVALTLKTLCGFSIPEIAHAFFTTDDTINKRLVRARQKIREANIQFAVPSISEMEGRLEAVLETIYLLFNEGYSASTGDEPIRYALCEEAIRLAEMLSVHPVIKLKGNIHALLALMLLNAARFRSRVSKDGNILTLAEQDRSLWERSFMQNGFAYLEKSTEEKTISIYHILATISAYHCAAADFESTDWKGILSMYDRMLLLENSPLVQLNRCIPLAKVEGMEKAIEQLRLIKKDPNFNSYHLLYATEGEFYYELKDYEKAAVAFEKAIQYSPLLAEKERLQKRMKECIENLG